jgi:hypothetical protein
MAGKIKRKLPKDRKLLAEMYHRRKMSLTDIAGKYGCSRQYVQLVFVELGIARRSRQEALKLSPRKRKSSFNFKPQHDRFIIANYRKMSDRQIALKLNKPVNAITYRRLGVLGKKKGARKNFSAGENDFILKNYKRLTDGAIARRLKRSLVSVTHHRSRILNRAKRHLRLYTGEEDGYIRRNYRSLTDGQLGRALNRSRASIAVHRNEVLGLSKSSRRKGRRGTKARGA